MRLLPVLVAIAASAAAAGASVPSEPRWYDGPFHMCGRNFAIDAGAGERIGYQQGPDFDLYFLQAASGGFALYEGFAPQTFENRREPIEVEGRWMERLHYKEHGWSYLISLAQGQPQFFLHLFGAAFQGTDADFRLVERLRVGSGAEIGCERPTAAPGA